MNDIDRRTLLRLVASGTALTALSPFRLGAAPQPGVNTKTIPSSGESITTIGMGTWRTFNVGSDPMLRNDRTRILQAFFEGGGQVVDCSPMYGSSQDVMGYALDQLGHPDQLFSAEKVWTLDGDETREQIAESAEKWNTKRFDLMQVHNMLSWQAHLDTLEEMKAANQLRYIGVTTSHGRRHVEVEEAMEKRDLDFIQITYNVSNRMAEQRLLPLAREKGIAVIANRPFGGGSIVDRFQRGNTPLPPWASEIDCQNWPQFLLKFIVSHPAVTCTIPATTQVEHMRENMGAAQGVLPDSAMRQKMLSYIGSL